MPMSSLRSVGALLVAAIAAPVVVVAQKPQHTKVGKAEVELEEPFDAIGAIRELRDGRLIVVDVNAKTLSLVNLAHGTATPIGREGQGPKEYRFPAGLLPLPGDTTLVIDAMQQRFLRLNPDGTPVDVIPIPSGMQFFSGMLTDRAGRIYAQGNPSTSGNQGRDSLPVLRWDRAKKTTDTLAWVAGQLTVPKKFGSFTTAFPVLFSGQDVWSVAPDGQLGIARLADYHVEWVGGAQRVTGPAIPYERVKVTDKEKEQIRAVKPKASVVIGLPSGAMPALPAIPQPDIADYKPPFDRAMVAPDSLLWIERATTNGAAVYDVIDRQGRLVRQVELPPKTRLIGFGAHTLYLARSDDDGLQRIGRYRWS